MGLISRVRSWMGRMRAADPALDDRYFTAYPGPLSAAGIRVGPDAALSISTVYRCVSLLANAFASLPFGMFRRLPQGREPIDHPVGRMLAKRPNPYQVPFTLKRLMFGHLLLRGNCYARIVDGPEGPELWPLNPDRVTGPTLLASGRLKYTYNRPDNFREESYIRNVDIFHVQGLSQDGLRGLALTDCARESFGLSMATEQHGARLFSQGTRLAGALTQPAGQKPLTPEARRQLSQSFGAYRGLDGAHGVPILEAGMDYKTIGMTADDAQFLETRKFTITDIARWFGIPPHMVGDVERSTSWGTGIEQQSIQFVQYGLVPWLVLWEEEIAESFISEPDVYAKFNVSGLLRADAKTRFDIYALGIEKGILSPNECRELEDRNPREGGDEYQGPKEPYEQTSLPSHPVPPPADEPPEDADASAMLSEQEARVKALASLRASAATLGVPSEHVRKLMAHAKTKDHEARS